MFPDARIVSLDWNEVVQVRMFGKFSLDLAGREAFVCDDKAPLDLPIPKECGKRNGIDVIPRR